MTRPELIALRDELGTANCVITPLASASRGKDSHGGHMPDVERKLKMALLAAIRAGKLAAKALEEIE